MSSRLSPAQSPAHVEIIGLNAFAALSAAQHRLSIGIWGGGQMIGQQGEKGGKKKKKRERRVTFTMQSKAQFKMIRLGMGAASTGHAGPQVQLSSTFMMSSSIHWC